MILHDGKMIWVLCLSGCLYGRWDGMFVGTGRFSSRVYMRMFLFRTISPAEQFAKSAYITRWEEDMGCMVN